MKNYVNTEERNGYTGLKDTVQPKQKEKQKDKKDSLQYSLSESDRSKI